MKKVITLISCLLSGLGVATAQETTALPLHPEVGATWHYKEIAESKGFGDYPYDRYGFVKVTIEKDTLFEGYKVQKVRFSRHDTDAMTPSSEQIRYWHYAGGKAYELRKDESTGQKPKLLLRYDLDAKEGDTLLSVNDEQGERSITVVKREVVDISGQKLIRQIYKFHYGKTFPSREATVLQLVGLYAENPDKNNISMDDIVDFELHNSIMKKHVTDPYYPTSFRCYSDGTVSYKVSSEECDWVTPPYPQPGSVLPDKGAVWYYDNPSSIGYTKATVTNVEAVPHTRYASTRTVRYEVFEQSALQPDSVFERKFHTETLGLAQLGNIDVLHLGWEKEGEHILNYKKAVKDKDTGEERTLTFDVTLKSSQSIELNGTTLRQQVYRFRLDDKKTEAKEWEATILGQVGILPNPGNAMYQELQKMAEGDTTLQELLSYYTRGALRCFENGKWSYKSPGIEECQKATSTLKPTETKSTLSVSYQNEMLHWHGVSLKSITLYNAEGSIVLQHNMEGATQSLSAPQLPKGTYIYLGIDLRGLRHAGKVIVP